eukprot:2159483-Pyramimonas_sp.AAC.1
MRPGSRMRAAVDRIDEHWGNISPELEAEIDSILHAPLDDTVAEGPHAAARHHHLRARRGTSPWIASSMRLENNLEDVR